MLPSRLEMRDDVLAPRESVIINYEGPNPIIAYHSLEKFLRIIFEAKGTHMFELDFRWDITEDPRPFFINFAVIKGFDKFSRFWVDIRMQGAQPTDPTKTGRIRIEIRGFLTTIYKLPTIFHRIFFLPFIYLYHVAYYYKVRRRYIEYIRRGIEDLTYRLRELLKIPEKPI